MRHLLRKHCSQLWRFAVCGALGSVIDLSIVTVLVHRLGISPYIAYVPSSMIAASFVFIANKFFTFKNLDRKMGNQAMKFAMVYGTAIVLNVAMSSLFYWWLKRYFVAPWYEVYVAVTAKILAIGVGSVWNYTLSHGFVFKKTIVEEEVVIV